MHAFSKVGECLVRDLGSHNFRVAKDQLHGSAGIVTQQHHALKGSWRSRQVGCCATAATAQFIMGTGRLGSWCGSGSWCWWRCCCWWWSCVHHDPCPSPPPATTTTTPPAPGATAAPAAQPPSSHDELSSSSSGTAADLSATPRAFEGMMLLCHDAGRSMQLVFRYPEVVRPQVSHETLAYFGERMHANNSNKSPTPSRKLNPPSRQTTQPTLSSRRVGNDQPQPIDEPALVNSQSWGDTPYNMSSVLIAPFLCPKPALYNKIFAVTIDNTHFLSYPVSLAPKDRNKSSKKTKKSKQSTHHMTNEKDKSTKGTAGADDNSGPKTELMGFHVVFVISDEEAKRDNGRRRELYKRVAFHLSTALKHEQLRTNYLTSEIEQMLAVRDRWLWKQCNHKKGETPPNHIQLTDDLLNASLLAHELREIYHGLADEGQVQVCINRWIDIHLSLHDTPAANFLIRPYHTLLLLGTRGTILKSLPQDCSPTLRAFINSVNPSKSFEELALEMCAPLSQLYRMASHLVYWKKGRIMKKLSSHSVLVLDPRAPLPFQLDQSIAHSFPAFRLPEVLELFRQPRPLKGHMKALGKASTRVGDFENVVVWCLRHGLLVEWNTYFYLNIPRGDSFSLSLPSHSNSPSPAPSPSVFLPLIHEEDDTNELHFRPQTSSPSESPPSPLFPSDSPLHSTQFPLSVTHGDQHHFYGTSPSYSFATLLPHETAYLAKLDDNSEHYRQFIRMVPLLRGKHDVEDILWRQQVSREEFQRIKNKYKNILLLSTHEAPEERLAS
eukprot:TRINITY_DN5677_c0_g1_i1.p1 TRINITY_DN5677_c0_g1~~TRINITY_DN5677_c0_g1_i1.p1  ORF type:complete len:779 (+),score=88.29 TRINITY_DN5677_c0_g1_i1:1874-4210(+)